MNMKHLIPSYLTPNILTVALTVVAVAVLGLHRALRRAGLPARDRRVAFWSVSVLLAAWFLAALALSWSGFYETPRFRIPAVPFGLMIPIASGIALFWRWPLFRRAIEAVPQSWLVGIQFFRVEGLIFLILYAGGKLPGAFALPAGIGDVAVGILAPLVALNYMAGARRASSWLWVWNLLGIADLVSAVTTGFLTSPSPLQLLALDHPNELISSFPLAMVPVFLVPLSVLLHLASLEKLRRLERARSKNSGAAERVAVGW